MYPFPNHSLVEKSDAIRFRLTVGLLLSDRLWTGGWPDSKYKIVHPVQIVRISSFIFLSFYASFPTLRCLYSYLSMIFLSHILFHIFSQLFVLCIVPVYFTPPPLPPVILILYCRSLNFFFLKYFPWYLLFNNPISAF